MIDAGQSLGIVWVDAEKLMIVLANLISNASRHTPAGGRVTLGATLDSKTVRFTVRDTGEGIDAHELSGLLGGSGAARVIAPRQGRHGLGLTIAREIVLQHGGELNAQSLSGHGSNFVVTLPNPSEA